MKLDDIISLIDGELLTKEVSTKTDIDKAIACDLLSWAVGNACAGCAFITIQTGINTVAVASLMEMGCIIIAENARVDEMVIMKASEEGIPMVRTRLAAFEVCGLMYKNDVKAIYKDENIC